MQSDSDGSHQELVGTFLVGIGRSRHLIYDLFAGD